MFKSGCSKNKVKTLKRPICTHTHYLLKSKIKKAFTLAEVLITLGIIAVVAAMTIPNLIANFQKDQTATQLKKAYTNLLQAIKQSEVDNGPVKYWDWGTHGDATSIKKHFDTYWAPYLSVIKDCRKNYLTCGFASPNPYVYINNTYYDLYVSHPSSRVSFITKDGTYIMIMNYTTDGIFAKRVFVDLNGSKKPNKVGRDLFKFTVDDEKGLIPHLNHYSTEDVNTSCTTNGDACTAKIMKDGWKIADDYPWK